MPGLSSVAIQAKQDGGAAGLVLTGPGEPIRGAQRAAGHALAKQRAVNRVLCLKRLPLNNFTNQACFRVLFQS